MNKFKRIFLASGLLAILLFTGCDVFNSLLSEPTYSVNIVNQTTDFYVKAINITESSAESWGDNNLMPQNTSLDPGEEITLEIKITTISTPKSISMRVSEDLNYFSTKLGINLNLDETIYITDDGITN